MKEQPKGAVVDLLANALALVFLCAFLVAIGLLVSSGLHSGDTQIWVHADGNDQAELHRPA